MTQTRLLNSPGLPGNKLVSALGGENRNMDTVVYWEVFESTGLIEAYLTYRKSEEVSSNSSESSEKSTSKSFEGEK